MSLEVEDNIYIVFYAGYFMFEKITGAVTGLTGSTIGTLQHNPIVIVIAIIIILLGFYLYIKNRKKLNKVAKNKKKSR